MSIIRWCKLRMCDDYVVIMWPRPSSFIWAAKPERDQSEPSAKEARHLANLDKLHDVLDVLLDSEDDFSDFTYIFEDDG